MKTRIQGKEEIIWKYRSNDFVFVFICHLPEEGASMAIPRLRVYHRASLMANCELLMQPTETVNLDCFSLSFIRHTAHLASQELIRQKIALAQEEVMQESLQSLLNSGKNLDQYHSGWNDGIKTVLKILGVINDT